LALLGTGLRTDILIHPGHGYLASLGCLNLTNDALLEPEDIDFVDSLHRTIELIEDLRHFCGLKFPPANGYPIPSASIVIDESRDLAWVSKSTSSGSAPATR
jgi:hypothetical protein